MTDCRYLLEVSSVHFNTTLDNRQTPKKYIDYSVVGTLLSSLILHKYVFILVFRPKLLY